MPELLSGTAARQAKSGDHLVEDQERAVLAGELTQREQEFAPLRQQAVIGGHRLDDDGGDACAFALQQLAQRRFVIERQHPRAGGEGRRHARRGGLAEGGKSRARGHQQVVGMSVVAAGKLDDQLTPGEGARHTDRAHHRFGSGGNEAYLLGLRVGGHDALGELHFRRAGRAVGRAVRERRADCGDHLRVSVPGDQRTPGADEVEVTAPVGIARSRRPRRAR